MDLQINFLIHFWNHTFKFLFHFTNHVYPFYNWPGRDNLVVEYDIDTDTVSVVLMSRNPFPQIQSIQLQDEEDVHVVPAII